MDYMTLKEASEKYARPVSGYLFLCFHQLFLYF